jgi:hypothetical protein
LKERSEGGEGGEGLLMGKPPAALWLTAHGVHAAVTIEISMAHRSPGDRLLMQMVLIFFFC